MKPPHSHVHLVLALVAALTCGHAPARIVLVSQALDPATGGNDSALPTPALSHDGRYVAFTSKASNLTDPMPNPNDDEADVYLRDLWLGITVRVSDPADGGDFANGRSVSPSLSADGRVVAFTSHASDLIVGDVPGPGGDIYVRDMDSGITERISRTHDGVGTPNGPSSSPSLSADGRRIAFHSLADNLVAGDVADFFDDVFVHDRDSGITRRISVGANSFSQAAAISADGRRVVFTSRASNLVPDDLNDRDDVFVHDLDSGITQLVSTSAFGSGADRASSSPAVSGDGRYVVFATTATNLIAAGDDNGYRDIYLRDLVAGTTQLISRGMDGALSNGHSYSPCISADGQRIGFSSDASNLVPDDSNGPVRDVFVHEPASGRTWRVSRAADGGAGNDTSENCGLSGDGRYIAFESTASNLLDDDGNGHVNDIFHSASTDRIFDTGFEPAPQH